MTVSSLPPHTFGMLTNVYQFSFGIYPHYTAACIIHMCSLEPQKPNTPLLWRDLG